MKIKYKKYTKISFLILVATMFVSGMVWYYQGIYECYKNAHLYADYSLHGDSYIFIPCFEWNGKF